MSWFITGIKNLVRVTSDIEVNTPMDIPGIGTGAAYASGDAFGTMFLIPTPRSGTISNVTFYDLDDEGLNKELVIFKDQFEETADNSTFAISDIDLLQVIGIAYLSTWSNFGNNQIGLAIPALSYVLPKNKAEQYGLWCQVVTRGADNIAAGSIPKISMVVV